VETIVTRRARLAMLSVVAVLLACNALSVEKIATPEGDARARAVLRSFVAGERDSVLAHARFGDDSAAIATGLAQLDSVLLGRRVDSVVLMGANRFSSSASTRLTLSYEMHSERGWLAAAVTTLDSAGSWALLGVNAETLRGELRDVNAFDMSGRGLTQWAGLALVGLCAIFTLGVAVFLATRSRYPKRWRWVLASLVGVGAVSINWTTGDVGSRLFTVQLLAASAVRPSEFAPWILSFSFPVGAIVALDRYRRWRERGGAAGRTAPLDTSPPTEVVT
jgi:hypothetical protein